MSRVSASEFLKNYGLFREKAQREPVTITNHGRDSLVLVSADEYQRLKSFDTRKAYYAHELPEEWQEALEQAKPPAWTAKYNHELEE